MTPGGFAKGTISCTGSQFCGQAKINTKGNSEKFSNMLDAKYDMKESVRALTPLSLNFKPLPSNLKNISPKFEIFA